MRSTCSTCAHWGRKVDDWEEDPLGYRVGEDMRSISAAAPKRGKWELVAIKRTYLRTEGALIFWGAPVSPTGRTDE